MANTFFYETIDPANPTGPKKNLIFRGELLDHLLVYRPVQIENLRAVREILDNPKRIFSQIRRPISEGGWCFTGMPSRWSIKVGITAPFPSDNVFAVFVRDTMEVYTWRAEYSDDIDPLNPKDWKNRFGGLVWKGP